MTVRDLAPKSLWNNFADLNAVPRPSHKEEQIVAFIKQFGEQLGFDTIIDKAGNVIIRKPATLGYEGKPTVILQSHLDMVCQKNNGTQFDFDTQGIRMLVDGDWVKADGTTLGADNGIGCAAIMSVLQATDIEHPAIEALFTICEEDGLDGANKLEQGLLQGKILLNLDTEEEDEFSIGCAGGIETYTEYHYATEKASGKAYEIIIKGLRGGHSGIDIILERGNAIKILNRLLFNTEEFGLRLASFNGGNLRNAIPREAIAVVTVETDAFVEEVKRRTKYLKDELKTADPNLEILIRQVDKPQTTATFEETLKIVNTMKAMHNGVFRRSVDVQGLVETSSSFSRITLEEGLFKTESLQRSSVESGKYEVAETVGAPFRLIGAVVRTDGDYPGWKPNPTSDIVDLMVERYEAIFGEKPKVSAMHAGLECGIIGSRYPGLDMISFGPTIRHPHSPDEKVNIRTVGKFWTLLVDVLKHI